MQPAQTRRSLRIHTTDQSAMFAYRILKIQMF